VSQVYGECACWLPARHYTAIPLYHLTNHLEPFRFITGCTACDQCPQRSLVLLFHQLHVQPANPRACDCVSVFVCAAIRQSIAKALVAYYQKCKPCFPSLAAGQAQGAAFSGQRLNATVSQCVHPCGFKVRTSAP